MPGIRARVLSVTGGVLPSAREENAWRGYGNLLGCLPGRPGLVCMKTILLRIATDLKLWISPTARHRFWAASLILMAIMAVATLVYVSGGPMYGYPHLMYVPILLAALLFRTPGAVVVAVFGGLLLGPYMPLDVQTGEMQAATQWLLRTGMFTLVGGLAGQIVTALVRQIDRAQWFAYHDPRTGLPNRACREEALDQHVDAAAISTALTATTIVLHNLYEINTAFGPISGDGVLTECYARMTELMPARAQIFQEQSDTFVVLLPGVYGSELSALLERMITGMKQPFHVGTLPVHIESSTGIAQCLPGEEIALLVQKATMAAYTAKNQGLEVASYAHVQDTFSEENLSLLGQLGEAAANGELELHYQPKVALPAGEVVGWEALLRWHHPEKGLIPPGNFIPAAERTMLINPMTAWVLETALHQHAEMRQLLNSSFTMAVNVSTRNLQDPNFLDTVLGALQGAGMHGRELELEITESALMQHPERAISVINELKEMRIAISIDDFGAGYSSLTYLDRLQPNVLKIDRAFVGRMSQDDGAREIVTAAISLAHSMKLKVVAEGVEDLETYQRLTDLGCDIAQGYYIGRPMPARAIQEWWQRHYCAAAV